MKLLQISELAGLSATMTGPLPDQYMPFATRLEVRAEMYSSAPYPGRCAAVRGAPLTAPQ